MKKVLDAKEFRGILEKISLKFLEENENALRKKRVGIVGIHTRGFFLAKRVAELFKQKYRLPVPVGSLDITLYRDDVGEIGKQPLVQETDIPFAVEGLTVLLIDDVLYTGRTVRAALDALLELGRPQRIPLAVMIDRGCRELPIQPDYVGSQILVGKSEEVQLRVKEVDGKDGVWIV